MGIGKSGFPQPEVRRGRAADGRRGNGERFQCDGTSGKNEARPVSVRRASPLPMQRTNWHSPVGPKSKTRGTRRRHHDGRRDIDRGERHHRRVTDHHRRRHHPDRRRGIHHRGRRRARHDGRHEMTMAVTMSPIVTMTMAVVGRNPNTDTPAPTAHAHAPGNIPGMGGSGGGQRDQNCGNEFCFHNVEPTGNHGESD